MQKNNYNFNDIPPELRNLPQWIVWKFEKKEGKGGKEKLTKVPYQVSGDEAQTNNPRTWSTFATAVKFYLEHNYDGIGFVFSKRDNYIGIDIDGCVVQQDDVGIVNHFGNEIIDLLDSYTEFSPSKTGLHVIVKGSLPQGFLGTGRKNDKLGLEVYSHGRYFTFTGNRENANEIYERTDEIASLLEKYFDDSEARTLVDLNEYQNDGIKFSNSELWEKMFRSQNGDEIRALFDGKLVENDWSASDLALANHLAFWTGKSVTRMDSMFRETSLMRDKWDKVHHSSGETYGERTINMAIAGTSSTILDGLDDGYSISISPSTDDVFKDKSRKFMCTELGNAERIANDYGNVIRHVGDAGWYVWDGKRWKEDRKREIEKITAKVLRKLFKSDNEHEQKWAKQCEKRAIRMNSIKDMIPLVPAEREEFDKHKFLFNVSNGIIDLKTGELLQHDRNYMITKISNVEYDKNAKSPVWENFLESIFKTPDGQTDYEVIDFLQRVIGHSLTGDISEQLMFFLFGSGRNGKSTFINTIQNLMGDYGRQTNSETFIKKNNDSSINNDIARLVGARFVSAIESEEGQQLSESLVKQITGGERISARFLRQEFFEFTPEFKVFFTTNHKPIVKGIDEGIWRRIKLIPFSVTIPKESIDKKLPEKLSLEAAGILNWMIEGCLKWQKSGLNNPTSISLATDKYKEDMDIIEPFVFEKCFLNPLAKIEAKVLFSAYEKWCYENGEFALKNRTFYRLLETRNLKKERGSGNKIYVHGIGLAHEDYKYLPNTVTESEEKLRKVTKDNVLNVPFKVL
ncbi:phage/plasmid primase, P4 family [Psychrobacillus sp. FSL K6-1267]|uniref:phage/plasmid primase, P4 family n=1 Tax=Psychrobacillus sp. FSL K6-1267 TaxID=2921543 RepID=UPI0030F8CCDC